MKENSANRKYEFDEFLIFNRHYIKPRDRIEMMRNMVMRISFREYDERGRGLWKSEIFI